MAHTLTLLLTHVVFSTKERRPWLDDGSRTDVFAYPGGIARETGATALAINGTVDHVHLLVACPPALALSDLVRLLKTNSALWLPVNTDAPMQASPGRRVTARSA